MVRILGRKLRDPGSIHGKHKPPTFPNLDDRKSGSKQKWVKLAKSRQKQAEPDPLGNIVLIRDASAVVLTGGGWRCGPGCAL